VSTADGRVRCLRCVKSFTTFGNARRHYRETHQTDKTKLSFFCDVCNSGFQLKRYRDSHMLTSHGISQKMMKAQIIPENFVQDLD
jgi:uncharacterized Zn-finger protein